MSDKPSIEDIFKYAGQLFLESRHQVQQLIQREASLLKRVAELEAERDGALTLLKERQGGAG